MYAPSVTPPSSGNHRGEHVEAADLADKALAITVPNKFALWTAWATVQRGWALAGRGGYEDGIPLMEAGIDAWKATGARVGLTFFSAVLADTCALAGRFDRVEAVLADAHPLIAPRTTGTSMTPSSVASKAELTLSRCGDGRPSSDEAAAAALHYEAGIEPAQRKLSAASRGSSGSSPRARGCWARWAAERTPRPGCASACSSSPRGTTRTISWRLESFWKASRCCRCR